MSIRSDNTKKQIEMNSRMNEHINPQLDHKLNQIYDRFHTGKSIIMDDLKYLWLKDPEGYYKLTKSIVNSITRKKPEIELTQLVSIEYLMKNVEKEREQPSYEKNISSSDSSLDTCENIPELISSIKLVMLNMSDMELMDIMNNLYRKSEIKKQASQDLDDMLVKKVVMYTYEVEKEFNILA